MKSVPKALLDPKVLNPLRDQAKWLRRRLRCYQWKQWGRAGSRELRKRGVKRELAWNTAKSAHGPWRLSHSPALSLAMPTRYFIGLGLPELAAMNTTSEPPWYLISMPVAWEERRREVPPCPDYTANTFGRI